MIKWHSQFFQLFPKQLGWREHERYRRELKISWESVVWGRGKYYGYTMPFVVRREEPEPEPEEAQAGEPAEQVAQRAKMKEGLSGFFIRDRAMAEMIAAEDMKVFDDLNAAAPHPAVEAKEIDGEFLEELKRIDEEDGPFDDGATDPSLRPAFDFGLQTDLQADANFLRELERIDEEDAEFLELLGGPEGEGM